MKKFIILLLSLSISLFAQFNNKNLEQKFDKNILKKIKAIHNEKNLGKKTSEEIRTQYSRPFMPIDKNFRLLLRLNIKSKNVKSKVLSLQFGPHRIRGSAENNIAVAVDDGSIWHYNGATWFQETPTVLFRPLYSISVSENTIVGVGFDASNLSWKGLIVIGRRN